MRPEERVGTQLGSYRIEAVLGRGGMGFVYLAEHLRLRRKMALKVLPPDLAEDEEFRRRFERESQLAASLEHPNIVAVHDAGEADGLLYIAMRYVEGSDLSARIRQRGPLGIEETLHIISQAADGLDEAHAKGLVHRDVKPANILLAPSPRGGDRVYLSDFGLAREWAGASRLTKSGYFVGTIHYSAPEQFRAEQVDGRTDVYSLGCVLFECLTGRVPFDRPSDPAVMYAHLQEPPPRVSSLRADVPPAIEDVIATAMAKSKESRYPTCGELAAAAAAVLRQGRTAPAPTARRPLAWGEPPAAPTAQSGRPTAAPTEALETGGAVPPRQPRGGRRPWWWAAVAAVLVVGLGVGGFLVFGGDQDGQGGGGGDGGGPGVVTRSLLTPDMATATKTAGSGQDACQPPNEIPFDAERVIDGKPDTAWRVDGDGVGESLFLAWTGRVHIRQIGLLPGYAKVDRCDGTDRFPQNRVIEEVEYRFDDGSTVVQTFDRRPEVQYVSVDVVTGTVAITIKGTSPPGMGLPEEERRDYTVISEVEVYGAPAA